MTRGSVLSMVAENGNGNSGISLPFPCDGLREQSEMHDKVLSQWMKMAILGMLFRGISK